MSSVELPDQLAEAWNAFVNARDLARQWKNTESAAKAILTAALADQGIEFDAADLNAKAVNVTAGEREFTVKPVETRRLDAKLLEARHPAIYAECEKVSMQYKWVGK